MLYAVLFIYRTSEVVVRAQGFRPENFLFMVHEIIETLIAESYSGVHYDFQVPCLECLNMVRLMPGPYNHQNIDSRVIFWCSLRLPGPLLGMFKHGKINAWSMKSLKL